MCGVFRQRLQVGLQAGSPDITIVIKVDRMVHLVRQLPFDFATQAHAHHAQFLKIKQDVAVRQQQHLLPLDVVVQAEQGHAVDAERGVELAVRVEPDGRAISLLARPRHNPPNTSSSRGDKPLANAFISGSGSSSVMNLTGTNVSPATMKRTAFTKDFAPMVLGRNPIAPASNASCAIDLGAVPDIIATGFPPFKSIAFVNPFSPSIPGMA